MPALINLKTNLKSLGYGNDRPDGGSSNQPYVVTSIPDGEALRTIAPDFLLRNGYLNAINSLDDVERIGKWFIDLKSPSGLLFTAKQELLERQNPKLVNINRVYNPLSTLLQTGFLSTGLHLNKQGINPYEESYYVGGTYGYFNATRGFGPYPTFQTLSNGDIENRLTIAYTAKIVKQDLGTLNINPFGITRTSGDNTLLSYNGGPGSILGVGNTNIRIQNPTIDRKSVYQIDGLNQDEELFNAPHVVSSLKNQLFLSHKTPTYIYNPNFDYDKISSNPGLSYKFFRINRLLIGDEPLNSDLFGEGDITQLLTRNITSTNPSSSLITDDPLVEGESAILNPNIEAQPNNVIISNNPSINWKYDFFLDRSTVSSQFLKLYPTDEIYNTLYLGGNDLETQSTLFTPGGTPDLNVANNDQINYTSGITGFEYDPNIYDPKTGLIPFNKHPWITWAYDLANYNSVSSTIFSETNWGSGSIEANASDILFPSDFTLNKTGDNIANNLNITKSENIGVNRRFEYNNDITDINTYLIPLGKDFVKYTPDNYLGLTKAFLTQSIDYPNSEQLNVILLDQPPYIDQKSKDSSLASGIFQFSTTSYKSNIQRSDFSSTGNTNGFNDFRNFTEGDGKILPSTDYTEFNRTKTYKTSATAYKGNHNGTNYILDPNVGVSSDLKDLDDNNDLINFKITTINTSGTRNPIIFRAYLEDWGDNYKAEWNGIKYMGRAEQLYKYNGFSRDGSITFNVPVLSKLDLSTSYKKLNQLINTVAPFYSTATSAGVSGLLTGTITEVTMGDYWKNMPVLVNSIGYTPISDMGWDIARNTDGTKTSRTNEQLPKGIKVSMNFTIIHNYTPQYGSDFIIN
jgi:hypothetical protein